MDLAKRRLPHDAYECLVNDAASLCDPITPPEDWTMIGKDEHELPESIRNDSSTQDSDWMRTTSDGHVWIKATNGKWFEVKPDGLVA
jgi:hypothetical protein